MEDLQSLLEKINREGVEKAEAKAKEILSQAQEKADAIVKSAREEALKIRNDAKDDASDYVKRAEETISQASRDTVLNVEKALGAKLEKLLVANVEKALADEECVTQLVKRAIEEISGKGEFVCGEKLAKTLVALLAENPSFTVTIDESIGSGFTVRLDAGRLEHSYRGEVLSLELAKRLRPELAKLIK